MARKPVPFPTLAGDHPARRALSDALGAWNKLRRSTGRATFTRGMVDVLAVLYALLDDSDEARARACLEKLRRTAREYVKARNPTPQAGSDSDDILYTHTMLEKRVDVLRFIGRLLGDSAREERARLRSNGCSPDSTQVHEMEPIEAAQWIWVAMTITGWFKPPKDNPIERMTEVIRNVEYAFPSVASSAETVKSILIAFGLSNKEASDAVAGYGEPVCKDEAIDGMEEEFGSAAKLPSGPTRRNRGE